MRPREGGGGLRPACRARWGRDAVNPLLPASPEQSSGIRPRTAGGGPSRPAAGTRLGLSGGEPASWAAVASKGDVNQERPSSQRRGLRAGWRPLHPNSPGCGCSPASQSGAHTVLRGLRPCDPRGGDPARPGPQLSGCVLGLLEEKARNRRGRGDT